MTFSSFVFLTASDAGSKPSLLDVNGGLAFWTTLTFIVLLLVLAKYAWKPILSALDAREQGIKDALEAAKKAKEEADLLIAQNEKVRQENDEAAKRQIEESRKYFEEQKAKMAHDLKEEFDKKRKDFDSELVNLEREMVDRVIEKVADVTVAAAEKVIRANLDAEKNKVLVNKYIDEIRNN
ncbi:MAG: F0F1 ATP synthase subunit B [Ignavibacteria bacterium]|nr:F0F1 ATP synthase subunit B [Ignavibacteria bacterium]